MHVAGRVTRLDEVDVRRQRALYLAIVLEGSNARLDALPLQLPARNVRLADLIRGIRLDPFAVGLKVCGLVLVGDVVVVLVVPG